MGEGLRKGWLNEGEINRKSVFGEGLSFIR